MIITQIKKIGKGERYSIFLDGSFNCALEAEILVREKLKEGQEVSQRQWDRIRLENGNLACFSRSLSYLEKGLRTQKQLQDYLKEKGYPDQSITQAIEKLSEYGYIDDAAFAESYIRTYKSRKGARKLKFELLSKGVSSEIAEEKLAELISEEETVESCRKLLEKYLKGRPLDPKLKAKAYAHLAGKGYASDVVMHVLSEVKNEDWD